MAMAPQKLKNMTTSLIMFIFSVSLMGVSAASCSKGGCKVGDECSVDGDCGSGTYCFTPCNSDDDKSICVRSKFTDQFKLVNNSLPFNKYAFLMTHNSYAIKTDKPPFGPRVTFVNQDDSVAEQLKNGIRGLMLDFYDFKEEVWLCHSFGAACHDFTAFKPAVQTLKDIESFLSSNPSEIVTLIVEDYVEAANGLTDLFKKVGLRKYWYPVSEMPKQGKDWPKVKDMVEKNHRLLVFTSNETKQEAEGIAYQWNYMVENQFGNGMFRSGVCPKRKESSDLDDRSKALVLLNHFPTIPTMKLACEHNSKDDIMGMLDGCYNAAGRWANFISVDYYKQSDGGGVFEALDKLNGQLICGKDDVNQCVPDRDGKKHA